MGRNERLHIRPVPRLFDVVELANAEKGVAAGSRGTVVEELPEHRYLVEFMNEDGKTSSVQTVPAWNLIVHA
jgi:hypothetical protein